MGKSWDARHSKALIRAFTAAALVVSTTSARASDVGAQINSYLSAADDLQQRVNSADIDESNKSDLSAIERHYQSVKRFYIESPLRDGLETLRTNVQSFSTAFDSKLNDFVTGRLQSAEASDGSKKSEVIANFNVCIRDTGGFSDFQSLPREISRFEDQVNQTFSPQFTRDDDKWNKRSQALESGFRKVSEHLDLTSRSWMDQANNCCRTKLQGSFKDPAICGDLSKLLKDDKYISDHDGDNAFYSIPPVVDVPDDFPRGFTGKMLAEITRDNDFKHELGQARAKAHSDDLDAAAEAEKNVYADFENDCAKNRKKSQKDASPIDKTLLVGIGKLLKCTVIPTIGVAALSQPYQKMTTALGAVPIQGDDWDMNCDPGEMAAYDAMRPTDAATVAKQWGLDGLANPPYIENLRRKTPLSSPFPILPLPGGGLTTPFGDIGVPGAAGTSVASSGVAAKGATSRGIVASSSSRVAAMSRSNVSRTAVRGRALTQGVRTVAARIENNQQVGNSINVLGSGVTSTRTLAKNMVANTQAMGNGTARRLVATTAARQGRTITRGLVAARTSRITASSMSSALVRTVGGSVSTTGSVAVQNDADRARIQKISQTALSMITDYITKSQSTIGQIQELIARRDMLIAGILPKLIDKAPGKQASIMEDLRNQLTSIDGKLGTLNSEYSMYEAGVRDQSGLLQRLNGFSPMNTAMPSVAGTTLNSNFLRPATNFPAASSPTTWNRDSAVEWLKRTLIPLPFAMAASQKLGGYGSEQEWRAAYNSFVKDFGRYIKLREKEEMDLTRQARDELDRQSRLITVKSATDESTEALSLMGTFTGSVLSESDQLIAKALNGALPINQQQVSALKKVRSDAQDTQDSINALHLMYKDSYPLTADDNPEIWWGMIPEMLTQ